MQKIIYGLACPKTHEIKYVGQCGCIEVRLPGHLAAAKRRNRLLDVWIRSIRPQVPFVVKLEVVEDRRVRINGTSVSAASIAESKWLKRFRRTVLNEDKRQCQAYEHFINNPELDKLLKS